MDSQLPCPFSSAPLLATSRGLFLLPGRAPGLPLGNDVAAGPGVGGLLVGEGGMKDAAEAELGVGAAAGVDAKRQGRVHGGGDEEGGAVAYEARVGEDPLQHAESVISHACRCPWSNRWGTLRLERRKQSVVGGTTGVIRARGGSKEHRMLLTAPASSSALTVGSARGGPGPGPGAAAAASARRTAPVRNASAPAVRAYRRHATSMMVQKSAGPAA